MALFVLSLILLLTALLFFLFSKNARATVLHLIVPLGIGVLAVILLVCSCLRTVPTGHTGIVTVFGRVEETTFESGVHFCAPWKTVINMDNRNQKASVDLLCFSSDIQEVSVTYTLNYQIAKTNAQTIYKDIGISYYETVIMPQIQQAVKSELAKYTAEELLSNRAKLSTDILSILTAKLSTYHILVVDASVENLDFSDAFTDAVEAKQVAEQRSKQAQIEQTQKTMEANAAAERAKIEATASAAVAVIAANADLDVVKIQADAAEYAGQKDAAIIGQVRDILAADPDNLTNEDIEQLLLYYYIQKWDGTLPQTYLGSDDFYAMLASLGSQTAGGGAPEVTP